MDREVRPEAGRQEAIPHWRQETLLDASGDHHPDHNPSDDVAAAAEYRPVTAPRLWPTAGQLFFSPRPVSRAALEDAVHARLIKAPLPVRPKISGFVAFEVPDDDSGLDLVTLLSNGSLSVLRHAVITRDVPKAALSRAERIAVDHAAAKIAPRELSRIERSIAQAQAHSNLLAGAYVEERESPIYYAHGTGYIFVAEKSARMASEVVAQLDIALDGHTCKPARFQQPVAAVMSRWLVSDQPPEDFAFGQSALLEGTAKEKAKFDNHDLTCQEVVEHIRAGMQVTELQLVHRDRVKFTLTKTGFIKGIELLHDELPEGLDGLACDLVRALHYAELVVPAIAAALSAAGGCFGVRDDTAAQDAA